MYIIIEIENNPTLFQWTNNFIIYLISRVSSQFQIFLSSTVIRKKRLSYRCYRITIRTIFFFCPTYFQTKTRWNQLNRRNEVIRRKRLVASPILLTCVTGLLADSTIPVESCSTKRGPAGSSLGRSSESNCSPHPRLISARTATVTKRNSDSARG